MKDLNIIGAEVYAVINSVSKEKLNKIPPKVLDTFKKYEKYTSNITVIPKAKFEEQNICKEAKDIIFAIAFNYWLTEEEKKEVLKKLQDNENIKNTNFNPDNIFKKFSNSKEDKDKSNEIVEVNRKGSWITKIFRRIISFFKFKNRRE